MMPIKFVAVPKEVVEAVIEYMEYEHDGDPNSEDARAMGEMMLDDLKRDGWCGYLKTALSETEKDDD